MPNLRPTEGPTLPAVQCIEFKAPCGWDDVGKVAEGYDYAMRVVYALAFLILGTALVVTQVRKNRLLWGLLFIVLDITALSFTIFVTAKSGIAFDQICAWHEEHRGMSHATMRGWSIAALVLSWVAEFFTFMGQLIVTLPPERY